MYRFLDANFIVENEAKQEEVLLNFQKFINSIPDNITLQLVLINKLISNAEMQSKFFIRKTGDKYDHYRDEYNKIIDDKIKEGKNNIQKEKYFILTVKSEDYDTCSSSLLALETGMQDIFKLLNKDGFKEVGIIERLNIMHDIMNKKEASEELLFENKYKKYMTGDPVKPLDTAAMKRSGTTVKNLIAPAAYRKIMHDNCIQLAEDRFCRSLQFTEMPMSLNAIFLTNITNVPCEMVCIVNLASVPKKKAINMVKFQNNSVKADVIKESQRALKNGYDPSLMNEDLMQQQEEARELRNDVVIGGKKLFYTTISVSLFDESVDLLKNSLELFEMKCANESLKPNPLIGSQERGFKNAMCTGQVFNTLDYLLSSDSICALNPFNIQEISDKGGHFYGINLVSKNMIMCNRKRLSVANGLIFGQSGSGKSFITKGEIIPNLLDGSDDVIILDPENEYAVVAEKLGGIVIDLKTKTNIHINPCDMSMEYDEPEADPLTEKCDYLVGLVESIMGKGRECNSFEVNVIHRAASRMYEPYIAEMDRRREEGIKQNMDVDIMPTLVDFYNCLLEDNSPEGNKVAMAIEPYCIGNYNIFAYRTNIDTSNRFVVYNLLYLPDKMNEMAMKVCLASIWNKIVKNRENNTKNGTDKAVWVYLDEFHLFFQTESSAETIKAYFKRVRKYNGIMTGITQDADDLLRIPSGLAMYRNSGFKLILKQEESARQSLKKLLSCSDSMIENLNKTSGVGLIDNNQSLVPFNYRLSNDTEIYQMISTNPNDESQRKEAVEGEETDFKSAER